MAGRTHTAWLTAVLWTAVVLLFGNSGVQAEAVGSQWLATGVVTRTGPDMFYLLGKDDVIYRIDAKSARVLVNDKPGSLETIQVGDKVRVFGRKTGEKNVRAIQLNLVGSVPKAEVTPPPEPPRQEPVQPVSPPAQAPAPPTQPVPPQAGRGPEPVTEPSFRARGLVQSLHLTEGWLTLLTGTGPVLVDLDQAQVTSRGKNTSSAELSVGDAVYIWGERTATGQVMATRVDILAEKTYAEAVKPVAAVSATGMIRSLDYPSFTFVLDNAPGFVFVMSDESTQIRSPNGKSIGFSDLKLGMKVKVSGLGSLTTGYLAQQIVVIGMKR